MPQEPTDQPSSDKKPNKLVRFIKSIENEQGSHINVPNLSFYGDDIDQVIKALNKKPNITSINFGNSVITHWDQDKLKQLSNITDIYLIGTGIGKNKRDEIQEALPSSNMTTSVAPVSSAAAASLPQLTS